MNRRPYPLLPSFLGPELGQSFENFLSPVNTSLGNLRDSIFSPRTDVRENGDHYAISVDMPGVATEDIDVEVNDGILTIQGSRRSSVNEESDGVHRVERLMGTFQRRFALPDNVEFESVSATCSNGVLEVRVPKLPERAPRKIQVQTRAGENLLSQGTGQTEQRADTERTEQRQAAETANMQDA